VVPGNPALRIINRQWVIKLLLTLLYRLVTAGEDDREVRVSEGSTCPLEIIGVVRTNRTVASETPVQSVLNRDEHGVVEIFESYAEGLDGLSGFDYARPPTAMPDGVNPDDLRPQV
jgi:hypothetical protein